MTTEDDFQAALDADPTDWQTRLVFADWLQDRGDPRADGYRALGALRLWPRRVKGGWYWAGRGWTSILGRVPPDWFVLLSGSLTHSSTRAIYRHYKSRRATEDAAALAFAKLPADRRAELLATVPA